MQVHHEARVASKVKRRDRGRRRRARERNRASPSLFVGAVRLLRTPARAFRKGDVCLTKDEEPRTMAATQMHVSYAGEGNFKPLPFRSHSAPRDPVSAGPGLDLKKIAFEALPWDLELHCNLAPCAGRRRKPSS